MFRQDFRLFKSTASAEYLGVKLKYCRQVFLKLLEYNDLLDICVNVRIFFLFLFLAL